MCDSSVQLAPRVGATQEGLSGASGRAVCADKRFFVNAATCVAACEEPRLLTWMFLHETLYCKRINEVGQSNKPSELI